MNLFFWRNKEKELIACVDCAYFVEKTEDSYGGEATCSFPRGKYFDTVYGYRERSSLPCSFERTNYGHCGPDAINFIGKEY